MHITRRTFLQGCGLTAAAMTGCIQMCCRKKADASRPNIVLVLMDDMGWIDLGCYGSQFYETPNVDRLAGEGMRFTDAYAAAPVCSPTRASLMSGKYPARVGVTNFIGGNARGKLLDAPYIDHLPLEEKSLGRALHEGGYQSWHVGKWHLGGARFFPDRHGFDVNVAGCGMGAPRTYFSPYGIPTLSDGPKGEYLTDRLTDEAIKLIKGRGEKPFFLNFCHYAVHVPIQAKASDIEKYKAKRKRMGLEGVKAFEEGDFFPCEHKKTQRIKRRLVQSDPAYAAMIENLDENIGRLLKAIDEAGQSENTIVIFTSDNGGLATAEGSPTCNKPLLEGKGWMYEGGTREPLLVKWPGVTKAGSTCAAPVTSPDFYPTLLEMAGLAPLPNQHVDGESLVPLLRGGSVMKRDAIFWHYPHYSNQGDTPGSSVRMGDWKLIEYFEDGRLELYNLREDVGETKNLAAGEPQRAKAMQARLAEWRNSVGARIPEKDPEFVPWRASAG